MIQKSFVPSNLALLAKDKGFNEPCLALFYGDDHKFTFNNGFDDGADMDDYAINSELVKGYIAAPLYQQLVDWFREKHDIIVSPEVCSYSAARYKLHKDPEFRYRASVFSFHSGEEGANNYDEYYAAFNMALQEAFKLIN